MFGFDIFIFVVMKAEYVLCFKIAIPSWAQ